MSYLFLIDNPNTEIFLSDKNVVQIYSRSLRQTKPKSNTKVFGLGFSFAKIRVVSAFFGRRNIYDYIIRRE